MLPDGLKVKGIFLDLDGTIVDSTEAYLEAARIAFQAIGLRMPKNEAALDIPRRLEQGFTLSDITNGDSKKFLSVYLKTYYSVTAQKTKLIPNVSATLEVLAKKYKLALITMRYVSKPSRIARIGGFWHFKVFHSYCNRFGYF